MSHDEIRAEAQRYLAKTVPGWDEMPDYLQTHAVWTLASHAIAYVEEEELRRQYGDSTLEPKGLLAEWGRSETQ